MKADVPAVITSQKHLTSALNMSLRTRSQGWQGNVYLKEISYLKQEKNVCCDACFKEQARSFG